MSILSIRYLFMFCLSLLHPSIDMREIGFKNDLSRFYDPSISGRRLGFNNDIYRCSNYSKENVISSFQVQQGEGWVWELD